MRASALAAGAVRSSMERPSGRGSWQVSRGGVAGKRPIPAHAQHQFGGMPPPRLGLVVRGDDQPLCVFANEHSLAEISDPDGCLVVLLARIWEDKITKDHPELRAHLEHVLATVTQPDHAEPDPRARRRRYYRRGVGPSRWLLVVVSFEQQPGRIITAVATRKDPKRWKP
jgi:hypothetical protein